MDTVPEANVTCYNIIAINSMQLFVRKYEEMKGVKVLSVN